MGGRLTSRRKEEEASCPFDLGKGGRGFREKKKRGRSVWKEETPGWCSWGQEGAGRISPEDGRGGRELGDIIGMRTSGKKKKGSGEKGENLRRGISLLDDQPDAFANTACSEGGRGHK